MPRRVLRRLLRCVVRPGGRLGRRLVPPPAEGRRGAWRRRRGRHRHRNARGAKDVSRWRGRVLRGRVARPAAPQAVQHVPVGVRRLGFEHVLDQGLYQLLDPVLLQVLLRGAAEVGALLRRVRRAAPDLQFHFRRNPVVALARDLVGLAVLALLDREHLARDLLEQCDAHILGVAAWMRQSERAISLQLHLPPDRARLDSEHGHGRRIVRLQDCDLHGAATRRTSRAQWTSARRDWN
mmetsp:Transcript_10162/g.28841  ORF Transcript_10162/g.28841 Transcript_10162/m.28841 type:complete len:237 (+) Transcript_10162:772-1482(+)